jgi:D-serine deaminase-like pyridoxal phosphate-dependent protein
MAMGRRLEELDTPCVVVDLDLMERNIQRMAAFAAEHGLQLRPHAKSHKTLGSPNASARPAARA